jgi:hypothetical protein
VPQSFPADQLPFVVSSTNKIGVRFQYNSSVAGSGDVFTGFRFEWSSRPCGNVSAPFTVEPMALLSSRNLGPAVDSASAQTCYFRVSTAAMGTLAGVKLDAVTGPSNDAFEFRSAASASSTWDSATPIPVSHDSSAPFRVIGSTQYLIFKWTTNRRRLPWENDPFALHAVTHGCGTMQLPFTVPSEVDQGNFTNEATLLASGVSSMGPSSEVDSPWLNECWIRVGKLGECYQETGIDYSNRRSRCQTEIWADHFNDVDVETGCCDEVTVWLTAAKTSDFLEGDALATLIGNVPRTLFTDGQVDDEQQFTLRWSTGKQWPASENPAMAPRISWQRSYTAHECDPNNPKIVRGFSGVIADNGGTGGVVKRAPATKSCTTRIEVPAEAGPNAVINLRILDLDMMYLDRMSIQGGGDFEDLTFGGNQQSILQARGDFGSFSTYSSGMIVDGATGTTVLRARDYAEIKFQYQGYSYCVLGGYDQYRFRQMSRSGTSCSTSSSYLRYVRQGFAVQWWISDLGEPENQRDVTCGYEDNPYGLDVTDDYLSLGGFPGPSNSPGRRATCWYKFRVDPSTNQRLSLAFAASSESQSSPDRFDIYQGQIISPTNKLATILSSKTTIYVPDDFYPIITVGWTTTRDRHQHMRGLLSADAFNVRFKLFACGTEAQPFELTNTLGDLWKEVDGPTADQTTTASCFYQITNGGSANAVQVSSQFRFNSAEGTCCDYFELFDGTTTAANPPVATWTGGQAPVMAGGTQGEMLVKWTTDKDFPESRQGQRRNFVGTTPIQALPTSPVLDYEWLFKAVPGVGHCAPVLPDNVGTPAPTAQHCQAQCVSRQDCAFVSWNSQGLDRERCLLFDEDSCATLSNYSPSEDLCNATWIEHQNTFCESPEEIVNNVATLADCQQLCADNFEATSTGGNGGQCMAVSYYAGARDCKLKYYNGVGARADSCSLTPSASGDTYLLDCGLPALYTTWNRDAIQAQVQWAEFGYSSCSNDAVLPIVSHFSSGELWSPLKTNGVYSSGGVCFYALVEPTGARLQITIQELGLLSSDGLTFYDGNSTSSSTIGSPLTNVATGVYGGPVLESTGPIVLIKFQSSSRAGPPSTVFKLRWQPKTSSCQPLVPPPHASISTTDTAHNTVVSFSCSSQYTLWGNPTTKCIDGQWSNSMPECTIWSDYMDLEEAKYDVVWGPGGSAIPTPGANHTALTCSISPELPETLNFNTSTGRVDGFVTKTMAGQEYEVTCTGTGGSVSGIFTVPDFRDGACFCNNCTLMTVNCDGSAPPVEQDPPCSLTTVKPWFDTLDQPSQEYVQDLVGATCTPEKIILWLQQNATIEEQEQIMNVSSSVSNHTCMCVENSDDQDGSDPFADLQQGANCSLAPSAEVSTNITTGTGAEVSISQTCNCHFDLNELNWEALRCDTSGLESNMASLQATIAQQSGDISLLETAVLNMTSHFDAQFICSDDMGGNTGGADPSVLHLLRFCKIRPQYTATA